MGDLISLTDRRAAQRAAGAPAVSLVPETAFAFDLGSPATYLAAERVDRAFPDLLWRPVLLRAREAPASAASAATHVERRAAVLGMPLVWPDGKEDLLGPNVRATRAAVHAAAEGRAGSFVVAAGRLAFCGGFDLDDPDVLAEAAAAAGLAPDACLAAAEDQSLDPVLYAGGQHLLAAGASRLPVLSVEGRLLCGEERLGEGLAGRPRVPERRRRPS